MTNKTQQCSDLSNVEALVNKESKIIPSALNQHQPLKLKLRICGKDRNIWEVSPPSSDTTISEHLKKVPKLTLKSRNNEAKISVTIGNKQGEFSSKPTQQNSDLTKLKMEKIFLQSPKIIGSADEASSEEMMDSEPQKQQLSEYEKQIQQNIEERKRFFQMMVSDAKRDFLETVQTPKKVAVTSQSPSKLIQKSTEYKFHFIFYFHNVTQSLILFIYYRKLMKEHIRTRKSLRKSSSSLLQDLDYTMKSAVPVSENENEVQKLSPSMQEFLKLMKTFQVVGKQGVKVANSKIYCMDWYPSSSTHLLSVGDKVGSIGNFES